MNKRKLSIVKHYGINLKNGKNKKIRLNFFLKLIILENFFTSDFLFFE